MQIAMKNEKTEKVYTTNVAEFDVVMQVYFTTGLTMVLQDFVDDVTCTIYDLHSSF